MRAIDSDLEDQEWLESYEHGEWHSVGRLQREIQRYQVYASSWLEKNRQVSLTLSASDFEVLRQKAKETGISYQVLLVDLVHQFVTGQIQGETG